MFKAIHLKNQNSERKEDPKTEPRYRANTTMFKNTNNNSKIKFRNRLINRIPKKIFIGLIGIVVIMVLFILLKSQVFDIKTINVSPQDIGCATTNQIINRSMFLGKKIFSISEKTVEANLKSQFICIESIEMKKSLPNVIDLKINQRQPILKITNMTIALPELSLPREATDSTETANFSSLNFDISSATEGSSLLVDKDGFAFNNANNSTLPEIYLLNQPLKLKDMLKHETAPKTQKILNTLSKHKLVSDKLILIDSFLLIDGPIKLAFSLNEDIDRQLASLQLILDAATINSKAVDTVDLRFDKPIVKYLPGSR